MVQKSERINRDWVLDQMEISILRSWCQGHDAHTIEGASCCFWDKRAYGFSITGALYYVLHKQPKARQFQAQVEAALSAAMGVLKKVHDPQPDTFNYWAERYNDAPARTKNEIIAWVKKAKEMPS